MCTNSSNISLLIVLYDDDTILLFFFLSHRRSVRAACHVLTMICRWRVQQREDLQEFVGNNLLKRFLPVEFTLQSEPTASLAVLPTEAGVVAMQNAASPQHALLPRSLAKPMVSPLCHTTQVPWHVMFCCLCDCTWTPISVYSRQSGMLTSKGMKVTMVPAYAMQDTCDGFVFVHQVLRGKAQWQMYQTALRVQQGLSEQQEGSLKLAAFFNYVLDHCCFVSIQYRNIQAASSMCVTVNSQQLPSLLVAEKVKAQLLGQLSGKQQDDLAKRCV